jgi:hypothetical protein
MTTDICPHTIQGFMVCILCTSSGCFHSCHTQLSLHLPTDLAAFSNQTLLLPVAAVGNFFASVLWLSDIEGHESSVLADMRYDMPLPRQIVVEVHLFAQPERYGIATVAPHTKAQAGLLFMHMASLGESLKHALRGTSTLRQHRCLAAGHMCSTHD